MGPIRRRGWHAAYSRAVVHGAHAWARNWVDAVCPASSHVVQHACCKIRARPRPPPPCLTAARHTRDIPQPKPGGGLRSRFVGAGFREHNLRSRQPVPVGWDSIGRENPNTSYMCTRRASTKEHRHTHSCCEHHQQGVGRSMQDTITHSRREAQARWTAHHRKDGSRWLWLMEYDTCTTRRGRRSGARMRPSKRLLVSSTGRIFSKGALAWSLTFPDAGCGSGGTLLTRGGAEE